jgi:flagellar M-ring protein FliF
MPPILEKLKTWWETSDRTQKGVTLGGISLLIVLLVGTFFFASKPKYALLYSGMNEADKSVVVTEIQTMGIPVKYDVPGQVEIPANKIGEVNMRLAGSGKLPKSAHPGIPDLEKMNLFSTPAQERERLKVILEGELAKSIESLDSVQAARVHITLGDNSPFIAERKPPTASVSVTETMGSGLTVDQGRAIASLVANACEGMDVNHVTVLNQRMQFVYDGSALNDERNLAADRLEMETRYAKQQEHELQGLLDAAFGAGTTLVKVTCEIDLDKERTSSSGEVPSEEPKQLTKAVEKMTGEKNQPLGTAGAASNTPQGPTDGNRSEANNYSSSQVTEDRALTTTVRESEKAIGGLRSMTINVLANSDRITDLQGLQAFLNGMVKNRTNDPVNFPLPTVTGVKFDTTAQALAAKAEADAASAARMQQIFSSLPIVALLLVAMMVVRQIGKIGKPEPELVAAEQALVADNEGVEEIELAEESPAITLGEDGLPSLPEGLSDAETDQLLAALRGNPSHELTAADAPEIKDKVDLPLEALKRMADDRPQLVGQLIKSMLLEERK